MKLVNKFLTALAPISIAGVITPSIVSCSQAVAYSFNYGDDVNCIDSSAKSFHSIDEVRNAVKSKINKVTQETDVTLEMLNSELATKEWIQILYYELIATRVCFSNKAVSIFDWKNENNELSFKYNNGEGGEKTVKVNTSSICFEYVAGTGTDSKKVYIHVKNITSGSIANFRSYEYELCSITN